MSRPDLPADKVSRNPPMASVERKRVRIARITDGDRTILCSCGWMKSHPRRKVREERAQTHLDEKHGGSGMWF